MKPLSIEGLTVEPCSVSDLVNEFKDTLKKLGLLRKQFDDLCGEADQPRENVRRMKERIDRFKCEIDSPTLNIAIIGTVSAGKSTFTNGLIGQNIAPKRDNACTFLPLLYKYDQNEIPYLEVSNEFVKRFNSLLEPIRDSLRDKRPDEGEEVKQQCLKDLIMRIQNDDLEKLHLQPRSDGFVAVQETLILMQDFVRLIFEDSRLETYRDSCLTFFLPDWLPVIHVRFTPIEKMMESELNDYKHSYEEGEGKQDFAKGKQTIVLIDTPGPNDSRGHKVLSKAVDNILKAVDVICCVSDASAFGQGHNDEMLASLKSIIEKNQTRVYVLLNKFDKVDGNTTEQDLIRTLENHIPMIPRSRVFVVKALHCATANEFRNAFNIIRNDPLIDSEDSNVLTQQLWDSYRNYPWFKDFVKITFGDFKNEEKMKKKFWKSKKYDFDDWQESFDECFEISMLEQPMKNMLQMCYKNASLICLNKYNRNVKSEIITPLGNELDVMGTEVLTLADIEKTLRNVRKQLNHLPQLERNIKNGRDSILNDLNDELSHLQSDFLFGVEELFKKGKWKQFKSLFVKSKVFRTVKAANKYVDTLQDKMESTLHLMERDLVGEIRRCSSDYFTDLNTCFQGKYHAAIVSLDIPEHKDKETRISEILGLEIDIPENPEIFPADFSSLVFSMNHRRVVRARSVTRHFWYYFWMKDYIIDEIVEQQQLYKVSEDTLRSRAERHCKDRIIALFDHFDEYFKAVFAKKSDYVIEFISEIFSSTRDNLSRKKSQLEDKRKNITEAQKMSRFLKDTLLDNTRTKHQLFVESVRLTTLNDDSPMRYILQDGVTLKTIGEKLNFYRDQNPLETIYKTFNHDQYDMLEEEGDTPSPEIIYKKQFDPHFASDSYWALGVGDIREIFGGYNAL